jgi:hypothetical protein
MRCPPTIVISVYDSIGARSWCPLGRFSSRHSGSCRDALLRPLRWRRRWPDLSYRRVTNRLKPGAWESKAKGHIDQKRRGFRPTNQSLATPLPDGPPILGWTGLIPIFPVSYAWDAGEFSDRRRAQYDLCLA